MAQFWTSIDCFQEKGIWKYCNKSDFVALTFSFCSRGAVHNELQHGFTLCLGQRFEQFEIL